MQIQLNLLSDTTFGRGDGLAGLVDTEVEHDADTGLPFVRGRTLRGLLVEECSNLLFALEHQGCVAMPDLSTAATFLFGEPGALDDNCSQMQIGSARFPDDLRAAIRETIASGENGITNAIAVTPSSVLDSVTTIRRQTAVDSDTGCPEDGSLRSVRAILRGTTFTSSLTFRSKPTPTALALLAGCIKSLRRAGSGRNRGRGKISACLLDNGRDVTANYLKSFERISGGNAK